MIFEMWHAHEKQKFDVQTKIYFLASQIFKWQPCWDRVASASVTRFGEISPLWPKFSSL